MGNFQSDDESKLELPLQFMPCGIKSKRLVSFFIFQILLLISMKVTTYVFPLPLQFQLLKLANSILDLSNPWHRVYFKCCGFV